MKLLKAKYLHSDTKFKMSGLYTYFKECKYHIRYFRCQLVVKDINIFGETRKYSTNRGGISKRKRGP